MVKIQYEHTVCNQERGGIKMPSKKERTLEVVLNEGTDQEKKISVVVKRPNNNVLTEAQRVGAMAWTQCIKDGVMTKKELKAFMKQRDIWDEVKEKEEDKITSKIKKLEKDLYLGTSTKGAKMKLSKGRELAIEMRKARIELRNLIAERIGLEANTAESLSDNARFDFMVSKCTYHPDGKRVYNSLDDYKNNAEDEVAFAAASALAEMMYSLDQGFEEKLPENQFLKRFKLVDESLSLIDKEGNLIDVGGEKIDEDGRYIDESGDYVDKEGNKVNKDGTYEFTVTFLDDDGKPIVIEEEAPETKATKEATEDKTEE